MRGELVKKNGEPNAAEMIRSILKDYPDVKADAVAVLLKERFGHAADVKYIGAALYNLRHPEKRKAAVAKYNNKTSKSIAGRLERIEAKLDALIAHFNIEVPHEQASLHGDAPAQPDEGVEASDTD